MKTYTIGRNADADIVLTTNFCSRDHAKLTVSDTGKILLQDFSSNGTTINGKKIINQTVEIKYGDEILFGGVEKFDWSKIEKPEIKPTPQAQPNPTIIFIKQHATKFISVIILIAVIAVAIRLINTRSVETPILSPDKIYNNYKNAVAMVEVKYYIRIHTVANEVYFGLNDSNRIAFNKDKNELHPLTSEGTAFFIDSNGTLITNHHVVEPWQHDRQLSDYFHNKIKPAIQRSLREKGWGTEEPKFYGELAAVYIYPNGKRFSPENRIECSIRKAADDEDIDLASIQINSHELPANTTIVSRSMFETDERKIQVNTPAYVIGFPLGDELATNEDNELKCSSTSGSFTQEPAKYYIQYSAQTASGGSGSPVFNQYGKLVAITYLGSTNGQSFNRGILAKYLSKVK